MPLLICTCWPFFRFGGPSITAHLLAGANITTTADQSNAASVPLEIDPELFRKCRRFIESVQGKIDVLFLDERLAPHPDLTCIAGQPISPEYFQRLQDYWTQLRLELPAEQEDYIDPLPFPPLPSDSGLFFADEFDDDLPLFFILFGSDFDGLEFEQPEAPSSSSEQAQSTAPDSDPNSALVIPVHLLELPVPVFDSNGLTQRDPLEERLIRSLVFSLQHPHGILGSDGVIDPRLSLHVFKEALTACRTPPKLPFTALCIVYTDMSDEIPVHFGHSAWPKGRPRKPTSLEQGIERAFRWAMIGKLPTSEDLVSKTPFAVEQCAEHLALPFILKLAKEYLAAGSSGDDRTLTIFSLTQGVSGGALKDFRFCENCKALAKSLVRMVSGLRIVDLSINQVYQGKMDEEA